jgi:hypothetical protein
MTEEMQIDDRLIRRLYLELLGSTTTPQEGFITALCVAHMIWKIHHDGSGRSFHACVNEIVQQLGAKLQ